MENSDFIAIAHILRPQGRKGEVLAELMTGQLEQFQPGRTVRLAKPAQPQIASSEVKLEDHWMPMGKNAGRIVLKLAGIENISEAESLAGMDVTISQSDLAQLEEDTFYVKDLLGCTMMDGEQVVGEVVDVQFMTSADGRIRLEEAAPLLAVRWSEAEDAEPALIPFARAFLVGVDVPARRIVMNLPPGLVEAQEQTGSPGPEEA